MTKHDILEYFKDINHYYNNCMMFDSLNSMLNELIETEQSKLTLDNMPTIEAVPLDKLCEWLSEHSVNIPCESCRHFSNDYCMAIGDMNNPCPNKEEDWQRTIKGWMEGLDGTD